jgi:hypothetical protein
MPLKMDSEASAMECFKHRIFPSLLLFLSLIDSEKLAVIVLEEGTPYPDYPVGYSQDGKYAFLATNHDMDTRGLVKFGLADGSRETLFQDPRVDIEWLEHYPATEEPMFVALEDGKPSLHFFDEAHPSSKFFRGALNAFKGQEVSLESVTRDGRLAAAQKTGALRSH